MDPRRLLERMCKRHGVVFHDATRLLPLIQRALHSPSRVRDRILTLVDNNLALRSKGSLHGTPDALFRDLDDEVLLSVARILHEWNPTGPVLDLSGIAPDLFPMGFEAEVDTRELDADEAEAEDEQE